MARRGPSAQKRAADRRKRRRFADIVLDRLGERYDHPSWGGPRVDAVSELVLTILSQNTADTNSFRAFTALRNRYGSWDEVLAAPTDELEDVIRPGGLAPTKSKRIQHVLAEVHAHTGGTWDLAFLGDGPLDEARDWLTSLPGIGRKTASIILLFNFGRAAMPVDTHVHRVTSRLGMLPPRTPLDRAHDLLEEVLSPDEMYPFHVETIRHGRDTCRAPRPICGLCPLTDVCAYYVLAAKGKAPMAPIPKSPPTAERQFHDELLHGWLRPDRADASSTPDGDMPPAERATRCGTGTKAARTSGMDERNDPPTEQRSCPECQEPIGDTDTICPHCGATLVGG